MRVGGLCFETGGGSGSVDDNSAMDDVGIDRESTDETHALQLDRIIKCPVTVLDCQQKRKPTVKPAMYQSWSNTAKKHFTSWY